MKPLALPRERKLKTDEISSVFNFGAQKQRQYLRILISENDIGFAKFAVVVGKRIVRQSVQRNYCKRVIKELFRLSNKDMAGWNIVIQVRRKFGKMLYKEVAEEYLALTETLKIKH